MNQANPNNLTAFSVFTKSNSGSSLSAARLSKRQNELLKTIQKRSEKSVDLTTRKSELDRLQGIADDLSVKLEKMDIDKQLPNRIRPVQPATIQRSDIASGFMHF